MEYTTMGFQRQYLKRCHKTKARFNVLGFFFPNENMPKFL